MAKHYEIWISLEEWDGDSKISDILTTEFGKVVDLDCAKQAYQAVEEVAFAVKPHLNPEIKILDDTDFLSDIEGTND